MHADGSASGDARGGKLVLDVVRCLDVVAPRNFKVRQFAKAICNKTIGIRTLIYTVVVSSNVTRADYAGSEACAPCHAEIYDRWKGSPMRRMDGQKRASDTLHIRPALLTKISGTQKMWIHWFSGCRWLR